jgi:methyl-accepting chemotaxis protein
MFMGDQFNLTGDFRGSIINLKSRLENVQQSVGEIPSGDEETRKELQNLIQQLSEALQKAPQEHQEQVEAVAETAKALVDQAKSEKPNKTMLQITGEGLKQAAKNVAEALPAVLPIALQIVAAVGKLVVV